jgi:eukaryotic-like serine/threonine-protein kinase
MGSVWRAEDRKLGADVAVKLIDARHAQSKEILARFRREAQVAATIRSTYVVQILDCGTEDEVGASFIAMELLQGETLAVLLEREGSLEPRRVAHLLGHVGRALSVAHEKGIVHRDLKPDNVFLVQEGDEEVAKVLDFGIARWRDSGSEFSQLETLAGVLIGTPSYMSPEQATGRAADHQSDIWAYGAIAFECLTGQRPYKGDTLSSLFHAICGGDQLVPSRLAPVPPGFDAWFAQANARDKSVRFSCIKQAAEQLRHVCGVELSRTSRNTKVREDPGEAPSAVAQMRSAAAIPPKVLEARTTDPGRRTSLWTSPTAIALTFTAMAIGSFWALRSNAHDPTPRSSDRDHVAASFRVEAPESFVDDALPVVMPVLPANCSSADASMASQEAASSPAEPNAPALPTPLVVPVKPERAHQGATTQTEALGSAPLPLSPTAPSERRVQDASDAAHSRASGGLGDRNAAGF